MAFLIEILNVFAVLSQGNQYGSTRLAEFSIEWLNVLTVSRTQQSYQIP